MRRELRNWNWTTPIGRCIPGTAFIYMVFSFVPQWSKRIGLVVLTALLCLAWYIPTQLALRQSHSIDLAGQVGSLAFKVSPLLAGLNRRSMANIFRVVLPLVAAFWMLIPAMRFRWKSMQSRIIVLWITPGLLFFLLIYMADAVYLTFLAGGVVLAFALSTRERVSTVLLMLCIGFNTLLFLGARPLTGNSRADQAINFYVIKYCNYGIRHQWSSTIGINFH